MHFVDLQSKRETEIDRQGQREKACALFSLALTWNAQTGYTAVTQASLDYFVHTCTVHDIIVEQFIYRSPTPM